MFSIEYPIVSQQLTELAAGGSADKVALMWWIKENKPLHYHDMDPAHLAWYSAVKARWIKDFILSPRPHLYGESDRSAIASLLIHEDLSMYVSDQRAAKRLLRRHLTVSGVSIPSLNIFARTP